MSAHHCPSHLSNHHFSIPMPGLLEVLTRLLCGLLAALLFLARCATYFYLVERVSTSDAVLIRHKTTHACVALGLLAALLEARELHLPLQSLINVWLAAMQYEYQFGRRFHKRNDLDERLAQAHREEKSERLERIWKEEEEQREKEKMEEEERKRRREERFRRKHWAHRSDLSRNKGCECRSQRLSLRRRRLCRGRG